MISTVEVIYIDYNKVVPRVRHPSDILHLFGRYHALIPFGGISNVYQVYKHIHFNSKEAVTSEKVGAPSRSEV